MIVAGGHRLFHEVLGVNGVGRARRSTIIRVSGACLTRICPAVAAAAAAAAPVIIRRQCSVL